MTRELFEAHLLDYLYDLLDESPNEAGVTRSAMEAHLRDHPEAAAALEKAKLFQGLIAKAAKIESGSLEFKPLPALVPARQAQPTVLWGRVRLAWRPWMALAACLLIGIAGWSSYGMYRYADFKQNQEQLRVRLHQLQQERTQVDAQFLVLRNKLNEIQANKELASQERSQKIAQLEQENRSSQPYVKVIHPETYEAGAPYTMKVQALNLLHQPMDADVQVRVLNPQREKEIVPQEKIISQRVAPHEYQISLPPDLNPRTFPEVVVEVVAQAANGKSARLSERLKLFSSRFVTHLTTDKPMYKPGETVHFRSLTIERYSLKPPSEDLVLEYQLFDGKGEKVASLIGQDRMVDPKTNRSVLGPDNLPIRGVGAGQFILNPEAAGGEYTLTVSERQQRFPTESRKFIVNRYEHPRLDKELDFTRKTYGPGEEVVAACKVKVSETQKPLAQKPVVVRCLIDGQSYDARGEPTDAPWTLQTDDQGEVQVRFRLPKQMHKGQGTLSVQFTDGANVETLARPIPIVLNKLFVSLFPEGGDLVAGVNNRVYFHVRDPLDKPAELIGRLVDDQGQTVASLKTLNDDREPGANQGMGMFEFTPQADKTYSLKIDQPAGLVPEWTMPQVKKEGLILHIPQGVGLANEPIHVELNNQGPARLLLVGVYCRGRLLAQKSLAVTAEQTAQVSLLPEGNKSGVYRVTVFEELVRNNKRVFRPLAERLIYRSSSERVDLTLSTLRQKYVPGEKVMLSVQARNELEKPVPAILMLAVTDKSILTLADDKTARSMPTHFVLTSELRKPEDLEFMDFMLSPHPKAAQALDLLLGTQGWRRFAEQDPEEFRKHLAQDAERMLAQSGLGTPVPLDNYEEIAKNLDVHIKSSLGPVLEPVEQRQVALETEHVRVQAELSRLQRGPEGDSLQQLNRLILWARSQYDSLDYAWAKFMEHFWFILWAALAFFLIGMAFYFLINSVHRLLKGKSGFGTAAVWTMLFVLAAILMGYTSLHFQESRSNSIFSNAGSVFGGGGGGAAAVRGGDVNRIDGGMVDREWDGKDMLQTIQPTTAAAKAPAEHSRAEAQLGATPEQAAPAPPMAAGQADPAATRPLPKVATGTDSLIETKPPREELTENRLVDAKKGKAPGELADKADAGLGRDLKAKRLDDDAGRDLNKETATLPVPPGGLAKPSMTGEGGRGRSSAESKHLHIEKETRSSGRRWEIAEPLFIREYAHFHAQGMTAMRHDFQDTVYWHPVIALPQEGKITVSFELGDSVTTYQVTAYAHTLDGRLGAQTLLFQANLPFHVQAKLPVEMTATDTLQLPVAVANETEDRQQVRLTFTGQNQHVEGPAEHSFELAPQSRKRQLFTLKPSVIEGDAILDLRGSSGAFTDTLRRTIPIVPDGFPIVASFGGELDQIVNHDLVLPKDWLKGTLKLHASVYPSILADLQTGLESMLREPHGCFEQTSSTNYPNTMILNYMRETSQLNPEIERRARSLMDRGYQKLISFECYKDATTRRGYDWFGGNVPPHEALSAYGLMQFRDMAAVYPVDQEMLKRTESFLLDSRDGQGGFKRNPRSLDRYGRAPEHITNAYILWSLSEGGTSADLSKELELLKRQSQTSQDPYFLALVANGMLNLKQFEDAQRLLDRLTDLQEKDGSLQGKETSITGSGGRDLRIETTALTILSWLKSNRVVAYHKPLQQSMQWLSQQRSGHGGFGSTQSTILALKALLTFARSQNQLIEPGQWAIAVNGTEVAAMTFTEKQQDTMTLAVASAEKYLQPGHNRIRLTLTGKNRFPYSLGWTFQSITPVSHEDCAVRLTTELKQRQIQEGDTVRLNVTVKNVSGRGHGMTVAIIGLPAGLTLPEDFKQLKDHARLRDDDTKPGLISAWETRGRELILYWRDLAPDAVIEVPIDLIAQIPGSFRGPASRAYLYYNADAKHWVDPISVDIKPQ